MAIPNPVRGADELRTLTAIAAPPSASRLRQQKKAPLARGLSCRFQSGAYCTITFLV